MLWRRNWEGFFTGVGAATAFIVLTASTRLLDIWLRKLRRTTLGPEHSEPKLTHRSAGNDPVGQPASAEAKKRTGT
jgi:hypothetical protein